MEIENYFKMTQNEFFDVLENSMDENQRVELIKTMMQSESGKKYLGDIAGDLSVVGNILGDTIIIILGLQDVEKEVLAKINPDEEIEKSIKC